MWSNFSGEWDEDGPGPWVLLQVQLWEKPPPPTMSSGTIWYEKVDRLVRFGMKKLTIWYYLVFKLTIWYDLVWKSWLFGLIWYDSWPFGTIWYEKVKRLVRFGMRKLTIWNYLVWKFDDLVWKLTSSGTIWYVKLDLT
jgi:hypothetical protein